jgi:hypothetical protein
MRTLSHRIVAVAAIALLSACASKENAPQRAMTFSAPEQPSTAYGATPSTTEDRMAATLTPTPAPMAPAPVAQNSYSSSQSSTSSDRSTGSMPADSYSSSSASMSNQRDSMNSSANDTGFERAPRADRN